MLFFFNFNPFLKKGYWYAFGHGIGVWVLMLMFFYVMENGV